MLDNMSKQCDMRVDRLSGGMIRYDITVYIPSAGLDLLFKRGGWEAAVGDGSDDGGEATAEYHHVCRLHQRRPPRVAPVAAAAAAAFQRASRRRGSWRPDAMGQGPGYIQLWDSSRPSSRPKTFISSFLSLVKTQVFCVGARLKMDKHKAWNNKSVMLLNWQGQ